MESSNATDRRMDKVRTIAYWKYANNTQVVIFSRKYLQAYLEYTVFA
jgi:hypothetical protein